MRAKLIVESGIKAGTEIELVPDRPTAIGRSANADLSIPDVHISKNHCHIAFFEQHWTVTDLNSSNGTYINDRRLQSGFLADGDVLRVGKTMLRFVLIADDEHRAEPAAAAPVDTGLFRLLARSEEQGKQPEPDHQHAAPVTPAEPAPPTAEPAQSSPKEQPVPKEHGELFSLIKDKLRRDRK